MKSDSHSYKFKHLYGDPSVEKIKWENIVPNTVVCDSFLVKGNEKYAAFSPRGGGGNLQLLRYNVHGKLGNNPPTIRGHKGAILDFDFFPYNPDYVATSSDDGTVKIWNIPENIDQGMDITQEQSTLSGHFKKVNLITFNKQSSGILASLSFDHTLRIWDVNEGKEAFCLQEPQGEKIDHPTSLEWNGEGNLLGTCWKDKQVRIADPRQKDYCVAFKGHDGAKAANIEYMAGTDYLVTAGFSGGAPQRELKLWSTKDFSKPVKVINIDKSSGVMKPYWDKQLEVLFLCGKGDGNIRYWEFNNGEFKNFANDFKSNIPGRGYGMLPKYCCDPMKQEIARFLKLEEKAVELIPFVCPKADKSKFHDDIYPEVEWGFGQTGKEWIEGNDKEAIYKSMKPGDYQAVEQKMDFKSVEVKAKEEQKSSGGDSTQVIKEKDDQISLLQEKIKQLIEQNSLVAQLQEENAKLKETSLQFTAVSEELLKVKEENSNLRTSQQQVLEKINSVKESNAQIIESCVVEEGISLEKKLTEIKEKSESISESLKQSNV